MNKWLEELNSDNPPKCGICENILKLEKPLIAQYYCSECKTFLCEHHGRYIKIYTYACMFHDPDFFKFILPPQEPGIVVPETKELLVADCVDCYICKEIYNKKKSAMKTCMVCGKAACKMHRHEYHGNIYCLNHSPVILKMKWDCYYNSEV